MSAVSSRRSSNEPAGTRYLPEGFAERNAAEALLARAHGLLLAAPVLVGAVVGVGVALRLTARAEQPVARAKAQQQRLWRNITSAREVDTLGNAGEREGRKGTKGECPLSPNYSECLLI